MDSPMNDEDNKQNTRPDVEFIPYRLFEDSKMLAEGEWGKAFESIFKPTNEKRMVKLVTSNRSPILSLEGEEFSDLRREFYALNSLKHENIIKVFSPIFADLSFENVFEFIEGENLKKVIHNKSISYTLADILRWGIQAARALKYLHSHSAFYIENEYFSGCCHGNICPQNMFLNSTGNILKICDFSLSKEIVGVTKENVAKNYSEHEQIWLRSLEKEKREIRSAFRDFLEQRKASLTDWIESESYKICDENFFEMIQSSLSRQMDEIRRKNIDIFGSLKRFFEKEKVLLSKRIENWNSRNVMVEEKERTFLEEEVLLIQRIKKESDCLGWEYKNSYYDRHSEYMALETLQTGFQNEKSDIFSWGVVFWECFTRKTPPVRNLRSKQWGKSIQDWYLPRIENASEVFNQFIEKCTHKNPKNRVSISLIVDLLENMILSEDVKNTKVYQENTICFWNRDDDEKFELFYCNKLFIAYQLGLASNNLKDFSSCMKSKKNTTMFFHPNSLKNRQELGHGKYGKVYSAEYEGQKRAVKYLCSTNMIPFLKEFDALSWLKHENIVKIFGYIEDSGIYGIVMEFIDGTTLDEVIHDPDMPKQYSLCNVLTWNYQLASALDYMHSFRCLHRDVKPQNLLILNSSKRSLKVCDLGFAKTIENSLNSAEMGTLSYMAPEIFDGDRYNERCDVYSWAITFWECCTGEKPKTLLDFRSRIDENFSEKFIEFIENCASSDPSNRKSMFVIKNWLEDMLANKITFTETDLSFRKKCVCIWDEDTNELFHRKFYICANKRSETRFNTNFALAKSLKARGKFLYENVPFDEIKFLPVIESCGNMKLIEGKNESFRILKFPKGLNEKLFRNEFQIISKLKHENIAKLLGYTHDGHSSAIIIEHEGISFSIRTFAQVIHGEFYGYTINKILVWSLQTASALEYMHSLNIIHCDIKPANMIMMPREDSLQIYDFCLSRDLQHEHNNELVGTSCYMAPEVCRDGSSSKKSDVYSWAVTFWETITRKHPFTEYDDMRFSDEALDAKLAQIGNASVKFNNFIQTCMNKDPDKRWEFSGITTLLENMLANGNCHKNILELEEAGVLENKIGIWNQEHSHTEELFYFQFNFVTLLSDIL